MTETWLTGPVDGVPPILMPVAHALIQARDEVNALAPGVPAEQLWAPRPAATAGYHLIHLAGALDRLFTYARGEQLTDTQKSALKSEGQAHPHLDGHALARDVAAGVDHALAQLRATDPARVLDERRVGRAGLPSTVLGLLFHAAEHTTRHVGQFITTVKLTS